MRGIAIGFLGFLCVTNPLFAGAAGAAEPSYDWMSNSGDGNASLIYGSTETEEDFLFALICGNSDKTTEMTVYVDIEGSKVGSKLPIELTAGSDKLVLDGKISTDEMSGFHFAEAHKFKIKPVIALLTKPGPVTIKTGKLVTELPEKGRAKELQAFTKVCALP